MSIQISFLLRMVEMIGKHPPINVLKTSADVSALDMSLDDDDDDADIYGNDVDEKEARVSTCFDDGRCMRCLVTFYISSSLYSF